MQWRGRLRPGRTASCWGLLKSRWAGTPCTQDWEGAGRGGPLAWLGGAWSSVGSAAPGGEVGPARARRGNLSGGQGTASRRAPLLERRRRGGQSGERWGFGGAGPEAGQEGAGGAAAWRGVGSGPCPRSPLGVPPAPGSCRGHASARSCCCRFILCHSPSLRPGTPPTPVAPLSPGPTPTLTGAPGPVPLYHPRSRGTERPGRDARQRHSSALSHPCHLIPLPSSTPGLGTPVPSGPLSPGPAPR